MVVIAKIIHEVDWDMCWVVALLWYQLNMTCRLLNVNPFLIADKQVTILSNCSCRRYDGTMGFWAIVHIDTDVVLGILYLPIACTSRVAPFLAESQ